VVACGGCWFCRQGMFSLCDNGNPHPAAAELAFGHAGAGIFAYSHAFGGFPGSHAEYMLVPFADVGAFPVPSPAAWWTGSGGPDRPRRDAVDADAALAEQLRGARGEVRDGGLGGGVRGERGGGVADAVPQAASGIVTAVTYAATDNR
jgi:hypothetical protein